MATRTIIDVFRETVEKFGDRNALVYPKEDKYEYISWKEYYELAETVAAGFLDLGIKPGDGVAIMGFNSVPWFVTNMAAIMTGAVVVGCYTTNSADICQHILNDSSTRFVIVENDEYLQKILSIRDKTQVKYIIQYEGEASKLDYVYKWKTFVDYGTTKLVANAELLNTRIAALKPTGCCTLIYTSGTTGLPKGVMLSHDNIIWTTQTVCDMVEINTDNIERIVSYLPLSHVAAQMIDIYMPLIAAGTTWFAKPDALRGTLVASLKNAKPTIFLGVPRVWEKIMEKMLDTGRSSSAIKQAISRKAKSVGRKNRHCAKPSLEWRFYNGLVYKKVRKALGLSNCRLFLTGAAPISAEVLEYFASLNIPIYDIYGMSECSGPMTISYDGHYRMGSCGVALDGTQLKLDPTTGEICTKGRHVMMGYLNQPEKTREVIDSEGWLHSGDVGKIDDDGYLYIIGRIKELIVTSGGENIPPVIIEDNIKSELPIISNCMVIGDKRKYLTALITLKSKLDADNSPIDALEDSVLALLKPLGCVATTVSECIGDKIINDLIQAAITNANKKSISNAQNIQKFRILPVDFSIKGGELGPTLKLKRTAVADKYRTLINNLYRD